MLIKQLIMVAVCQMSVLCYFSLSSAMHAYTRKCFSDKLMSHLTLARKIWMMSLLYKCLKNKVIIWAEILFNLIFLKVWQGHKLTCFGQHKLRMWYLSCFDFLFPVQLFHLKWQVDLRFWPCIFNKFACICTKTLKLTCFSGANSLNQN